MSVLDILNDLAPAEQSMQDMQVQTNFGESHVDFFSADYEEEVRELDACMILLDSMSRVESNLELLEGAELSEEEAKIVKSIIYDSAVVIGIDKTRDEFLELSLEEAKEESKGMLAKVMDKITKGLSSTTNVLNKLASGSIGLAKGCDAAIAKVKESKMDGVAIDDAPAAFNFNGKAVSASDIKGSVSKWVKALKDINNESTNLTFLGGITVSVSKKGSVDIAEAKVESDVRYTLKEAEAIFAAIRDEANAFEELDIVKIRLAIIAGIKEAFKSGHGIKYLLSLFGSATKMVNVVPVKVLRNMDIVYSQLKKNI